MSIIIYHFFAKEIDRFY